MILEPVCRVDCMSNVTRILLEIDIGDPTAPARLLELVYDELRQMAAAKMAREPSGQTLQPTALVHEAYLRLVDVETPQEWNGRGHFFAAAAEAMRRILVEHARRKASLKAGGEFERIEFHDAVADDPSATLDIIALSDALERLHTHDPRKAEVVKLRYFAGLEITQIAEALGLSTASVKRDWTYSRAWLYRELNGDRC
ncbi:MAG: sigma-70 family RNA polymerase sigma factor [Planctomycetaceae bacterium]